MKFREFIAQLSALLPKIVQPRASAKPRSQSRQLSALPPEIVQLTALQASISMATS